LRINRILKSGTFRLAAAFSVLFLVLTGALMGTVLWIIDNTQTATLVRENDADTQTVLNGFGDEGIDEAIEVVRQRLGNAKYSRTIRPDCYMVLENGSGEILAGNLPAQPRRIGVFTTTLQEGRSASERVHEIRMLGRGTPLGEGAYFFVGRDVRPVAVTRERIIDAFVWVTAGAFGIASIAGVLLGRRFARRVDAVARACKSIVAGRLDERIEVHGRNDEWDRLASAINDMLNRIAALLENLRQVSSDVAHDLRTPLTRLRNRLENARAESSSTTQYAQAISGAIGDADQILSMFAALLRISQVEAGGRLARFASVNLSELCENVFRMYQPVAEDYGHKLTANLDGGAEVQGDAELLTQMLTNLIENAIHHTPTGTAIHLLLRSDEDAVYLSVEDDGPGIPADQTEKVLRRFYRLASSRTTAGHGLGLALVSAVVQLHDAGITLADGRPGLRVSIRFPVAADR
jgi:signal transduction histidine kinase